MDDIPAQYQSISMDLAGRIARGELAEGARLYGRSVLASEYAVSPETIRKALRLLAEMKVVEIKPQSGAVVLSADSARRYVGNFDIHSELRNLREEMKDLVAQYARLNRRLVRVTEALFRGGEMYAAASGPLPSFEVAVPPASPRIGADLGALRFWQSTGATVVAIRRKRTTILSPGPTAQLFAGDVLILVGSASAAEAASRFLAEASA